MLKPNARQILHIIGKIDINDPEDSAGIIMVDQMRTALTALQFAIDAEEASFKTTQALDKSQNTPSSSNTVSVYLHQRAYPIIEMLKRSQREGHDVTWEI
jgi:hypothetical protein